MAANGLTVAASVTLDNPAGAASAGSSPVYTFVRKAGPLRRKWASSKPLFAVLEGSAVRLVAVAVAHPMLLLLLPLL